MTKYLLHTKKVLTITSVIFTINWPKHIYSKDQLRCNLPNGLRVPTDNWDEHHPNMLWLVEWVLPLCPSALHPCVFGQEQEWMENGTQGWPAVCAVRLWHICFDTFINARWQVWPVTEMSRSITVCHTHLLSRLQASAQKKNINIVSGTQMLCATWYLDTNKSVCTYVGEAWVFHVCIHTLRHNI